MWRELLVSNTPFLLIVGGIATTSWVLEKLVRRTPIFGKPLRWLVKIISGLGFIIGILLMATGILVWAVQGWDSATQTLLIVTGIALFLKPIKDIRWASLIGLAAGCLCLGYVMLLNPLPPSFFGIESKWIYAVIFLVPTLFTYLLFSFVEDLLTFIGTILSFRLVAITIGTLCVIQGVLLLLNRSLFEILQTL